MRVTSCLAATFKSPKPFNQIPGPRPSLPFIGTSWIYMPFVGRYRSTKLHEANMDKFKRYGPIMKEEYQKGFSAVTIFDPKDIRKLYTREESRSNVCPMRPTPPYVLKHRQEDPSRYPDVGLANMQGEEWQHKRTDVAKALLSNNFKETHIGPQNTVATDLVKYLRHLINDKNSPQQDRRQRNALSNSPQTASATQTSLASQQTPQAWLEPVDDCQAFGIIDNIQDVLYRFSIESIMVMCINQSMGCLSTDTRNKSSSQLDGDIIFKAALDFFEAQHRLYYGSSLWKYYNTRPYKQFKESLDLIYDIAAKYIDVALNKLKNDDAYTRDKTLVGTLHSQTKFNSLEIKSTVVDFIGGGIYTMSNTITMTLFLLASNPEIQEKLYREICENCKPVDEGSEDIVIDVNSLDNMKFFRCCLKESYRLMPTIPGIARITHEDIVLSNYLVPKGTLVFSNFMVTCRLPQFFDEPDKYIPDRWLRGNVDSNRQDMAFSVLPFGHGVRKCIGHNFAEIEMSVALLKIIKHFKVENVDSDSVDSLDLTYKFIVMPEKPVKLKLTLRSSLKLNTCR